jgi:hypothetical protein
VWADDAKARVAKLLDEKRVLGLRYHRLDECNRFLDDRDNGRGTWRSSCRRHKSRRTSTMRSGRARSWRSEAKQKESLAVKAHLRREQRELEVGV